MDKLNGFFKTILATTHVIHDTSDYFYSYAGGHRCLKGKGKNII